MHKLAKKQVITNEHFQRKKNLWEIIKKDNPDLKIFELETLKKFEEKAKEKILRLEKQNKGIGFKINLGNDVSIKFTVRKGLIEKYKLLCYTFSNFGQGQIFKNFHAQAKQEYVKCLLNLIENSSKKINITILKKLV
ncbi:hypothetical protein KAJ89_00890 [Candidatus Parcubacteria bacterium]|nr:hypothetical protein [Candidatus Parcubacteria bacterium]